MKLADAFVKAADIKATKRRMIMALFGAPKTGKTHISLTAPGPIAYFAIEPGLEGVVEKFNMDNVYIAGIPNKTGIGYPSYTFAKPTVKSVKSPDYVQAMKDAAMPVWEKFMSDWAVVLTSDARTIVLDTASAAYDLGRFAYLGTNGKVAAKDDPYKAKGTEVKSIMRGLIGDAYSNNKNVILIAREKQVWKDGEPVDEFKPDGWEGLSYESSVVVRLSKRTFGDKVIRKAIVTDSRIDDDRATSLVFSNIEGKNVITPLDFVTIASSISNTPVEEWR